MGIFKGICRTVTSPIEVTTKTVSGVLDFSDCDIHNPWTFIDMTTLGASRVARKAANATKDTCDNISKDLDK